MDFNPIVGQIPNINKWVILGGDDLTFVITTKEKPTQLTSG
jgi:hypothetical protein